MRRPGFECPRCYGEGEVERCFDCGAMERCEFCKGRKRIGKVRMAAWRAEEAARRKAEPATGPMAGMVNLAKEVYSRMMCEMADTDTKLAKAVRWNAPILKKGRPGER